MGLFDTILSALGLGGTPAKAAASAGKAAAQAVSGASDDGTTAAMREGKYTAEEADELSYEDYDEDGPERAQWVSKRRNPSVASHNELHVIDLNTIHDGDQRRMFAVYGVPVGWGKNDEEASVFQQRIEAIEAVREEGDDEAISEVYGQWGFLDEEHYEWIRERLIPGWEERGAMQEQLDAQRADLKDQLNARAAGMAGELEPFMGVSMEAWASANAKLSQGGDLAALLPGLGVDAAGWAAVSEEWNARMSRDTTATIATVYGQAFTAAGTGQFGAAGQASAASMLDASANDVGGDAPISFERWIEITEAQNAGVARGEAAVDILAGFGMTPADWGTVGGWWSQRFAAEAMSRLEEFNQLSEKYRKQYGGE